MLHIRRDPRKTASTEFDVIIIGGGIYGITLALEAGRRGKKSLLLEKGDFGEYTSFNSLKIIHGGLRYLQSLDLHRFRESVKERSWFLRHFPDQVTPMPCLMPLYGKGMKRPTIFRLALLINHLLAPDRNKDLRKDHLLPMGGIVSASESQKLFPLVEMEGLQGSALWYDAQMPDSQLLVMQLLKSACDIGTTPLNYCQVESILTSNGTVNGVIARDRETGETHTFHASTIINSAGPWAGQLIKGLGGDAETIYRPSLAWNVLFNRPSLSSHALAVQAKRQGSRALFVTPWKGKIFAGCGHEPWFNKPDRPMPSKAQLLHFIDEMNEAIPGINLGLDDVGRVFCGLLPTIESGSNILTKREVLINHQQAGGPQGLFSIGGIKFTTARLVAEKIWGLIEKNGTGISSPRPLPISHKTDNSTPDNSFDTIQTFIQQDETIVHLDDLVLRRSTLWEEGEKLDLQNLAELFLNWDESRRMQEVERCLLRINRLQLDENSTAAV